MERHWLDLHIECCFDKTFCVYRKSLIDNAGEKSGARVL